MYELLVEDPETRANWDMADFIAVAKLNFNDHGEIHAKVAAASTMRTIRAVFALISWFTLLPPQVGTASTVRKGSGVR